MSTKDKELVLDELDEIELSEIEAVASLEDTHSDSIEEDGFELSLDEDEGLSLSDDAESFTSLHDISEEGFGEISLTDDIEGLTLSEENHEDLADTSLTLDSEDISLDLSEEEIPETLSLDDHILSDEEISVGKNDVSDDTLKKLQEIDAIMFEDASRVDLQLSSLMPENELDEPIFSDDLNFDSLNLSEPVIDQEPEIEKPKKKKKEQTNIVHKDLGRDLEEISGAYSGEMERMQATISNLRADREELLAKIQHNEEEKMLNSRHNLTVRAELDEKKIELTIIRKKLNEEINELKDSFKLQKEKRYILEEKNKILLQELEKASQRNKFDVKRVQMRERELEQKLELLKADAETQIRNRDLKILELKRKVDSMEFDMESITSQEKRSVESRFELEDKLGKAIKTLRGAISALEDDTDRTTALEMFKKNIDM